MSKLILLLQHLAALDFGQNQGYLKVSRSGRQINFCKNRCPGLNKSNLKKKIGVRCPCSGHEGQGNCLLCTKDNKVAFKVHNTTSSTPSEKESVMLENVWTKAGNPEKIESHGITSLHFQNEIIWGIFVICVGCAYGRNRIDGFWVIKLVSYR